MNAREWNYKDRFFKFSTFFWTIHCLSSHDGQELSYFTLLYQSDQHTQSQSLAVYFLFFFPQGNDIIVPLGDITSHFIQSRGKPYFIRVSSTCWGHQKLEGGEKWAAVCNSCMHCISRTPLSLERSFYSHWLLRANLHSYPGQLRKTKYYNNIPVTWNIFLSSFPWPQNHRIAEVGRTSWRRIPRSTSRLLVKISK